MTEVLDHFRDDTMAPFGFNICILVRPRLGPLNSDKADIDVQCSAGRMQSQTIATVHPIAEAKICKDPLRCDSLRSQLWFLLQKAVVQQLRHPLSALLLLRRQIALQLLH